MWLADAPPPSGAGLTFIEIALVIFFVVFLGIVTWLLLVGRGHFRREKQIPLRDDEIMTPRHETGRMHDPDAGDEVNHD